MKKRDSLERIVSKQKRMRDQVRKLLCLEPVPAGEAAFREGKMLGAIEVQANFIRQNIIAAFTPKPQPERPPFKYFIDWASFGNGLEKKGFKALGHGSFGSVYGKAGQDRVIKILHGENDGWLDYVTWANKKGYGGTFAPKLYSYKLVKTLGGTFGIASMERLEKTISGMDPKDGRYLLPSMFQYSVQYGNQKATDFLDTLQPGLAKFAVDFKEKFQHGYDLHRGNFMIRKDEQVVVTDPISLGSGFSNTRMKAKDFALAA